MTRRSQILERMEGDSPCLFCNHAISKIASNGYGDLSFIIPQLAFAVWEACDLSNDDRRKLNEGLADMIRCSFANVQERISKVNSFREDLLPIANKDVQLAEIVAEFLSYFKEQ